MAGSKFGSFKAEKGDSAAAAGAATQRRDPYEVLGLGRNATEQEIKSAFRRMALKYHPDKNADDPVASEKFQEATFSYNILSDPEKRRHYDSSGFEAIESDSQELELDLSSLNTVNTVFAALFSKLGVPIKTTVSATVLEEALNGSVEVSQLELGKSVCRKVEKQSAHFYSVDITEKQAKMGLVCRVHSTSKSKFKGPFGMASRCGFCKRLLRFRGVSEVGKIDYNVFICFGEVKAGEATFSGFTGLSKAEKPFVKAARMLHRETLLYFEPEENGGLSLALQEDSAKTRKVTSAGMFFLGFPVYRFEQNNSAATAKDTDSAFFKRLDGFQPCEVNELKGGTHYFAVYGDNFFKSVSYTIEVVCAEPFSAEKERLRTVESKILAKRTELSKFESEYREVLAKFTEMTSRYAQEMETIDELLKERNAIHASYTNNPTLQRSSSSNKGKSSSRGSKSDDDQTVKKEKKSKSQPMEGPRKDDEVPKNKKEKKPKDRVRRNKWFYIPLKVDKRRPC